MIDFPQSVDPRFNSSAAGLLRRDLENVFRHCARFGAEGDPAAAADEMWGRWTRGEG